MERLPEVRRLERDALLDALPARTGDTILDLQSAGGYVADAARERLGGRARTICLEPTEALRARISDVHTVVAEPVERFPSIPSNTVDGVLGLAALHHSEDHRATLAEVHRVLKPNGSLSICDVSAGTSVARWLNEYVDRNNPGGHFGRFPEPFAMARLLEDLGFEEIQEEERDVPWLFEREEDVGWFLKGLFALSPPEEEVRQAAERYLPLSRDGAGGVVRLGWTLRYVRARLPQR